MTSTLLFVLVLFELVAKMLAIVLVAVMLFGVFFGKRLWPFAVADAALAAIIGYFFARELEFTSGIVVGAGVFFVFLAFLAGSRH